MLDVRSIINLVQDPTSGNILFVKADQQLLPEMRFAAVSEGPYEYNFNPLKHGHEANSQIIIEGHKWIQIRLNAASTWSTPARFIGEDGKSVTFRVFDKVLLAKPDGEPEYTLFDLEELRGIQGIPGPAGSGCAIQKALFFDELATFTPSAGGTSCNSCSPVAHTGLTTVFVLGDNRNHILVDADWTGVQYHKVTGLETEWIPTTGLNAGQPVRFYGYDGASTATIKDATLQNTLGHADTVWINSDNIWHKIASIAQPTYKVAPNLANPTNGAFLEDYVINSETLELIGGWILQVKDNSIGPRKIMDGTFTYGFDEGDGVVPIRIKPQDFVGFGLTTYVDLNGDVKIQVDVTDLISDGLAVEIDISENGEVHSLIKVKAEDLVAESDNSALGTVVGEDGYKNFTVLAKGAIFKEDNAIDVHTDELTTTKKTETVILVPAVGQTPAVTTEVTKLAVQEASAIPVADAVYKGIQGKHIFSNVFNSFTGLLKNWGNHMGELMVNANIFKFTNNTTSNPTHAYLDLQDESIEGKHLHDNVISTDSGLSWTRTTVNNLLTKILKVVPDGNRIKIVGNKVTLDNIQGLPLDADQAVLKLRVNTAYSYDPVSGTATGDAGVSGNVGIKIVPTVQTYTPASGAEMNPANPIIVTGPSLENKEWGLTLGFNFGLLKTLIEKMGFLTTITSETSIGWGTLPKTVGAPGDSTTIETYVDTELHKQLHNWVFHKEAGWIYQLPSGSYRRIIIESDGTLGTEPVVLPV